MNSLGKMFGSQKPVAPTVYDDDEVYPLHMLDLPKPVAGFMIRGLLFNDQLDANVLHNSLARLADIGDWRKIGGRVRTCESTGYIEIHAPQTFTPKRPPLNFTHDKTHHSSPISSHPILSRLPTSSNLSQPSTTLCNDDLLLHLALRPNFPHDISEILNQDVPFLSLHVMTFSDATLIGLSWSHLLTDASGIHALLHSWSLVMAGRESEVPPVINAKIDMTLLLEQQASQEEEANRRTRIPPQDIIINKSRLGPFKLAIYIIKTLWEGLTTPAWQEKLIYIPASIKETIVANIKSHSLTTAIPSEKPFFVSTGDALTAWFTKLTSNSSPSRNISLLPFINFRYRFPTLQPGAGVYLQNMVLMSHVQLDKETLSSLGESDIAIETKRQTMEQIDQDQLIGFIRHLRDEIYPKMPLIVLYGALGDMRILVNNLINIDLIRKVDFRPAVVAKGDVGEERKNPLGGMLCFVLYRFVKQVHTGMHNFFMLGADHAGGHYFLAKMEKARWDFVEKELERLAKEIE